MERWAPHHPQLDARSHFNMTLNTTAANTSWMSNSGTRSIIANLQLAQVQTLRTMHLTLGAFSLAMTIMTVLRIISDAKRAAALAAPSRKRRFSALSNVHPAETFPLVLACGAVLQQILFVSVQSTALRSVLSNNCRGLAMITFPAIFLVGNITLVFGFEMTIRAFRFDRFAPRGKWNSTICVAVIAFLTLGIWMPTVAWPTPNLCFGSLIWFPVKYEVIALGLLISMVSLLLVMAALISIQLMRTTEVDPNERIAASRMCYFMVVAAVIYSLVIPVEVQAHRKDFMNTLATSRIAEIALFCSGMVITFFHLFLRVNATRFMITPVNESKSTPKQKRPRIRFFGPSDLEMNISGPIGLQSSRRPESRQGLIDVGPEKNRFEFDPEYFVRPDRPLTPASERSNVPVDLTKWPLPPDPVQTGYSQQDDGLHRRSKSNNYSLFPTRAEDIPRLPATVYSPEKTTTSRSPFSSLAMRRQNRRSSLGDTKSVTDVNEAFGFLAKPAPLFAGRHNRGDSTASSATVEIGLRFSLAPATLAAAKYTKVERSAKSPTTQISDRSLSKSPTSYEFPNPPPPALSPANMEPRFPILSPATYLQDQREKILPPTPKATAPAPAPAPPQPKAALGMSGLRMNPISPIQSSSGRSSPSPPSSGRSTPQSNRSRSPTAPSPTARIPLGAGTMARSPPKGGWI
ncbi:hypothetical protein DM02DRAFT_212843 [Periconia macrospinosa]|uniref:Uncharacterized protein n=1 Tax=Periconia macrospinosa TaxID=97972 RepID=A0A2V1E140_9PLEO|nr:hypothetical protein DM02DRAFT_212843 [Periconia macrospinosa]